MKKSMKFRNSFGWELSVAWIWTALCTAALINSSMSKSIFYVLLGVCVGLLLCSCLRNTYEIKNGNLHIHELNLWFFRYDYSLPIKNIDSVKLVWRFQFPFHALRLQVGSAQYTLNADEKVSKLLLAEINRLKQEEERV